ncbi:MAG: hypothetical protein C9356_12105 [Oleiphilus sp.]|nr:MAG: hypothetical protein C9356_12105 [Oleiphilus sp.]
MSAKHQVVKLIEDLHSARELIATLYDSEGEGVLDSDDPVIKRQISILTNLQLLISLQGDTYYLESDFTRVIDKGLRVDTISYLNSDVGEEIAKIKHSFHQYQQSRRKGNPNTTRKYEKELIKLFIAITQRFNANADELYKRVQANYGKMDYGEDRASENKFYQDKLEALKDSYHEVDQFLDSEEFQSEPLMVNLSISYKGRTMGFFDRVGTTLKLLKDFAYRTREQEIRTEQLRALLEHIERHPTENFESTEASAHECPVFLQLTDRRATTIQIQSYPDLDNDEFELAYGDLIEKLKEPVNAVQPYEREKSAAVNTHLVTTIRQQSLADKLLIESLRKIKTTNQPISAAQMLSETDDPGVNLDYWMYYLRKSYVNNRRVGRVRLRSVVKVIPVVDVRGGYSGNALMTDVVMSPKSYSKEAMNTHFQGRLHVK